MGEVVRYDAPPVIAKFMRSNARVRSVMGPFGSGKSSGCVMEVVRRACEQRAASDGKRYSRFAVVRDTYRNLTRTSLKTFLQWAGPLGRFTKGDMTFWMEFGDVRSEVMFLALDHVEQAIEKLKSLELTWAWVNEAAGGMSVDVLDVLEARVGRYPRREDGGGRVGEFGVFIDSNPPELGSWLWAKQEDRDLDDPERRVEHGWAVFKQPSGRSAEAENLENLPEDYYVNAMKGKTEDWIKVYVDGEYGTMGLGRPVFADFRRDYHVLRLGREKQMALPVLRDQKYPLVVGLDPGLDPAAVIMQRAAEGRVVVLGECWARGMAMDRFLEERLKPMLAGGRFKGCAVALYVDPSSRARSQVDGRTVLQLIRDLGLWAYPARTNDIQPRLKAVNERLTRQVSGGLAAFLVDGVACPRLVSAMQFGYRWDKKDPKPEKNEWSHIAEALQYGMMGVDQAYGGLVGTGPGRLPGERRPNLRVVSAEGWT